MSYVTEKPIEVPREEVDDLRRRLASVRWASEVGNQSWRYGVSKDWLTDLVAHWRDEYDWRQHEADMNAYPQFEADIDGVPVHFMHVRGRGPAPMPLLLTHGWPWTFWDFRDLIGPLTDPVAFGGNAADAFDVVVPSLPGFGFSVPLTRTGIDVQAISRLWVTLMRDLLGYDRFAAFGGDWGAIITSWMGHAHEEHLIGVQMSMPKIPGVNRHHVPPSAYSEDELWMLERQAEAAALIRSHLTVHSTDPQTLAYALTDSPTGTAAWIWERRRAWSDCGGDVTSVFTPDDLCTTASIYWLTGSIGSSLRLYYEHAVSGLAPLHDRQPTIAVPTGFAIFPKELALLPRSVAQARTNLQRWSVLPRGGHFAPAEQPALVLGELRSFFGGLR